MKRCLAILLALLMLAAFGCTKTPGGDTKPTEPPEEYDIPAEEGCNKLVFYWQNMSGDYENCDMWIWYPNADGRGYLFHPCEYGAKVVLNVPEEITEVGFIVRKNCSDPGGTIWGTAVKDYDGDRFAKITGKLTEVYLKPGDEAQYKSDDGGKTLYQDKMITAAGMISLNEIRYQLVPALRIKSLDEVKVTDGEREIPVTALSSLDNEVILGVITLGEPMDISREYTLTIADYAPMTVSPTEIFDSEAFNERYAYDGELGAIVKAPNGDTEFRLWAPTASSVDLNVYAEGAGGDAEVVYSMQQLDKGVWSIELADMLGKYYTYSVTTSQGTKEIVDPYAKAVGVNGDRGMVVDLDSTDPEGWENDAYYSDISAYNEAVIWEVHVRDFSNRITSAKYPGKYLAFTEKGLVNESGEPVGIDYLKDLGITHVHLQPVYDYATVDESSDEPQFNWGYDPKNYNVPEGSYSTDPYHGEVRIKEFKQMVQALHEAGLGVIMDVVYNHTYSADSCFSGAAPYYYYRYTVTGDLSNGSGCGNETASERAMFRKYMVDSVTYWASEYHIDGFRFDLMALHDIETMQEVEKAVHGVNPHALIYGEGWTGGTTTLRDNLKADQKNISQVTASEGAIGAIAVFNDTIRDGLKGSVFDPKDCGYINGKASSATADAVIFGLNGGQKSAAANWAAENNAVINYMACHDNNTLWDKLEISVPDSAPEERMLMNRLGAEIIMISRGVPFFLAGEEMLRTKGGDSNSYKSSDEVNNIDWDALMQGSDVMKMRDLYRALIEMRKANAFLTDPEISLSWNVTPENVIELSFMKGRKPVAIAIINPNEAAYNTNYGFELGVLMDGWSVTARPQKTVKGDIAVEGRSVFMAVMP